MGRPKKKVEAPVEIVIPTTIHMLPVDYGREDLNNIAKKINELTEKENARILGKQTEETIPE